MKKQQLEQKAIAIIIILILSKFSYFVYKRETVTKMCNVLTDLINQWLYKVLEPRTIKQNPFQIVFNLHSKIKLLKSHKRVKGNLQEKRTIQKIILWVSKY